jgi:transposase
MVKRQPAGGLRLAALVELLGPGWADTLASGSYPKTSLVLVEKYADPRDLKRLGRTRLAALLARPSRGLWREDKADELLAMATETLSLWSGGGIDFSHLAEDIAAEVRVLRNLDTEIDAIDVRIEELYVEADPCGVVRSAPGLGPVSAAAILGSMGDFGASTSWPATGVSA